MIFVQLNPLMCHPVVTFPLSSTGFQFGGYYHSTDETFPSCRNVCIATLKLIGSEIRGDSKTPPPQQPGNKALLRKIINNYWLSLSKAFLGAYFLRGGLSGYPHIPMKF